VFSTLSPNQDKRKTNCKKLKLSSGILPEEYQDYCNEAYGYSDHYWLLITQLDYHYSRNKTRLPVIWSLYSQRTLFQDAIPYIAWVISCTEHFTKGEVLQNNFLDKEDDSEAPINWFQVLSKNVKGWFPWDTVLRENLDTEEDTYSLQLYIKEDPRVFLSTPTYKEWIDKQNQIPSTYTQLFVEKKIFIFKSPRQTRLHNYHNHKNQGIFWDHIENNAQFANTHYPTHPDQCEGIEDACKERKDYLRSKQKIVQSAFDHKLNPYCLLGISYDLLYFWAESSSDTNEYTLATKKIKVSK
jgi:hypothetical protein